MIQRQEFERVFLLEIGIAGGVFVIVMAVLLVSVVRRRSAAVAAPATRSTAPYAEIGYVVMLAAIAVFLIVITSRANSREAAAEAAPSPTVVDVTAYQWCWLFEHERGAGVPPVTANGSCQKDPATRPTLVVPAGQPVALRLHANDVVHAFWIPDLRVKRDVFPTYENTMTITFPPGRFEGRCSEFCGPYHPMMEFWVQAVSPQDYQRYLASGGVGGNGAAA